MISRRVPGAFYRVRTLEGVLGIFILTGQTWITQNVGGYGKLGLACALYRPMPQTVGHSTLSFKLNYYYSFYFNTVKHGLLKAFVGARMRTLLAYVIDHIIIL